MSYDENKYPEHQKLKAISDLSQCVGEFIEWLGTNGYAICEVDKRDDWYPTYKSTNTLLADFFEIDQKVIDQEKEDMLEEFRMMSSKKEANV